MKIVFLILNLGGQCANVYVLPAGALIETLESSKPAGLEASWLADLEAGWPGC